MRSLKLSGLIRRTPDRPSLKQRAAALRATAIKVMRRPQSDADIVDTPTVEYVEPAGDDLSQPGFIIFQDAAGAIQRQSVAHWVGFMASRLNSVARQEMSRAYNAACNGLSQDECRPIEDRLRRDLRLDALHDLAFRWRDVFEASREYAIGHRWRAISDEAPKYDLTACTLPQLARLYETWESLFLHLNASGAIPCFSRDDDLTPAGQILEREYERASGFLGAIADEAAKRTPTNADERDSRLSVLIRHELNGNGRICDAALLSELAATAGA